MRSRVAIALAVASVLLSTASPALARCMVFGGRYARIGSGDVSASAPAIVLGLATDYHVRDGEPVPTRLRLGGHALTVETLAPGLVVARSSSAIRIGTLPLRGLATRISVTLAASTQGVALAAPDVASIGLDSMQHEARAMAELRTPSPAGAIAVVVAQGGTPIAWAPVDAPSARVEVAHESLCGVFDPEGYRFPSVGDVVTLAWVDAAGRLSQPSSPITVRSLEPRRSPRSSRRRSPWLRAARRAARTTCAWGAAPCPPMRPSCSSVQRSIATAETSKRDRRARGSARRR